MFEACAAAGYKKASFTSITDPWSTLAQVRIDPVATSGVLWAGDVDRPTATEIRRARST